MAVTLESLVGEGLIDTGTVIKVRNPVTIVRKTSDETVTSSTTLQSDNELLWAMAASEVWQFEIVLFVTAATASRIQVAFNVPSGATGFWGIGGLIFSATAVTG